MGVERRSIRSRIEIEFCSRCLRGCGPDRMQTHRWNNEKSIAFCSSNNTNAYLINRLFSRYHNRSTPVTRLVVVVVVVVKPYEACHVIGQHQSRVQSRRIELR